MSVLDEFDETLTFQPRKSGKKYTSAKKAMNSLRAVKEARARTTEKAFRRSRLVPSYKRPITLAKRAGDFT